MIACEDILLFEILYLKDIDAFVCKCTYNVGFLHTWVHWNEKYTCICAYES